MKVQNSKDTPKLYCICNVDDDSRVPKGKLAILKNERYVTVDMTVKVKSLVTAYKKFMRAIQQAESDDVLPVSYHEFATADSDSEEDIRNLYLAPKSKDVNFDVDDNTDIDAGFYLKLAVAKTFFEVAPLETVQSESTALVTVEPSRELQKPLPPFWEAVNTWLENLKTEKKRKNRTFSVYRYNMKVFKEWLDAKGITINTITRDDIKAWNTVLDNQKNAKTGEDLTVATKNLYLTTVRNFFKWLADEYGYDDIASGISGWQNTKEHKRGFLSIEEMKELVNIVDAVTLEKVAAAKDKGKSKRDNIILQGFRDKAILTALMLGGLRTIELSRLRVADMFNDSGACFLNVLGKGRDERETVKISRKAESVIRDWLNARETVDVISGDSPLFCSVANNSFGEPITSLSVSRLCKEYLTAAGLKTKEYKVGEGTKDVQVKPIVAHSLRGSLATNAFRKGAKLEQVQQQLRHKNISTTLIYLEEAEKLKNPCSDLVSDEIF